MQEQRRLKVVLYKAVRGRNVQDQMTPYAVPATTAESNELCGEGTTGGETDARVKHGAGKTRSERCADVQLWARERKCTNKRRVGFCVFPPGV